MGVQGVKGLWPLPTPAMEIGYARPQASLGTWSQLSPQLTPLLVCSCSVLQFCEGPTKAGAVKSPLQVASGSLPWLQRPRPPVSPVPSPQSETRKHLRTSFLVDVHSFTQQYLVSQGLCSRGSYSSKGEAAAAYNSMEAVGRGGGE